MYTAPSSFHKGLESAYNPWLCILLLHSLNWNALELWFTLPGPCGAIWGGYLKAWDLLAQFLWAIFLVSTAFRSYCMFWPSTQWHDTRTIKILPITRSSNITQNDWQSHCWTVLTLEVGYWKQAIFGWPRFLLLAATSHQSKHPGNSVLPHGKILGATGEGFESFHKLAASTATGIHCNVQNHARPSSSGWFCPKKCRTLVQLPAKSQKHSGESSKGGSFWRDTFQLMLSFSTHFL